MNKASLTEKFAMINEHWRPKVVAQLNGQELKLVKFLGVFPWHHHEHEDEMFLVVRGSFTMRLRDGDVSLSEGEFLIVPRGVEHMPEAAEEVHVLLFEPRTTLNTGNATDDPRTRHELKRL